MLCAGLSGCVLGKLAGRVDIGRRFDILNYNIGVCFLLRLLVLLGRDRGERRVDLARF